MFKKSTKKKYNNLLVNKEKESIAEKGTFKKVY